jgi:class 3 adenylate cyclase
METDEAGTLERLKTHRKEFIEPLIAEHRGRIVKLMGDGALCEFASVVARWRARSRSRRAWRGASGTCPRRSASGFASASISAT